MPTDDERREVARKLRETGEELGSAALLWYHIAKALVVRTATDGATACDMLADLIEPGDRACYYYDAETNHCRCYDTRLVDRDALLELADEMGRLHGRCDFCINRGECDWADEAICLENMMDDFADRIRKALGVDK